MEPSHTGGGDVNWYEQYEGSLYKGWGRAGVRVTQHRVAGPEQRRVPISSLQRGVVFGWLPGCRRNYTGSERLNHFPKATQQHRDCLPPPPLHPYALCFPQLTPASCTESCGAVPHDKTSPEI